MDRWDWTPFLAAPDDDWDTAHRRWYGAGIADGLPIVPPTPARVRAMYNSAGMDPARAVATLDPAARLATVYDVAVCAVAAGCRPAALPVVCAALAAMAEPSFNLLGIQTTTGTATPVTIVHGPAATRAEVSGGSDCLGGSGRGNATIGRAIRLVLRSVGGATPGGMDAATMGQPAKIGVCFAENLDRSPWPPLHTEAGLAAEESAVTVVGVSGSAEVVQGESEDPEEILVTLARSMVAAGSIGSRGLIGGGSPLVVLSFEHANALNGAGLDRAAVQDALWQLAVIPVDQLAPSRAAHMRRLRREAGEPEGAPLIVAAEPADILVAVAGGIGIKSTFFSSWGGGTRAVTRALNR